MHKVDPLSFYLMPDFSSSFRMPKRSAKQLQYPWHIRLKHGKQQKHNNPRRSKTHFYSETTFTTFLLCQLCSRKDKRMYIDGRTHRKDGGWFFKDKKGVIIRQENRFQPEQVKKFRMDILENFEVKSDSMLTLQWKLRSNKQISNFTSLLQLIFFKTAIKFLAIKGHKIFKKKTV